MISALQFSWKMKSQSTRDTFGIAVKATYAEDADGNPIMIMKQPKGCDWKKSQKGCCIVTHDENGNYFCEDGHTWKEACDAEINDFIPMFMNGTVLQPEETLKDIRERMYEYKGNMNI